MFGNHYFKIRQRLRDVVTGVVQLAEKTGAESEALCEKPLVKKFNEPFLFTVYGEKKAGKSTFLNALFGYRLCDVDSAITGDSVKWYLYGKKEEGGELSSVLQHEFRERSFLKDFNIVDTPGSNSLLDDSKLAVQGVLPVSDVVFWVFSVKNPWAASTWDMLSKQDQSVLDKSLIILQQEDLSQPEDIKVMLGHMNDLAQQRVAQQLPIFPVSAKAAYKAKLAKFPDRRVLERSGFVALERAVSEVMDESFSRKEVLGEVRDAAVEVLRETESKIEYRRKQLNDNEGFLRDIESEVEVARQGHATEFKGNLVGMRDVFENQTLDAMLFMRSKMSVLNSLKSIFITGHFSKKVEQGLIDLVKAAVEKQVKKDGLQLVSDCKAHWETLRPRVLERLTIELGDFDKVSEGFPDTRQRFTDRMGAATIESIVRLRIRTGLDRQLSERLDSLKIPLYVVLSCLAGAGITGFLGLFIYPYFSLLLLVIALIGMVAFSISSNRSRRDIMRLFQERLEDGRIPFADGLNSDYKEGVHDFYIAYGNLLSGVRSHIMEAKQELEPNLEQWNGLFLDLKGVEQDF